MSKWKETSITYGKCVNKIHGVQKDYCSHFLAGGERRRLSSAVAAVAIFVFMRKKLKRYWSIHYI